ncbi:ParA family protein [Borreliella afzelii]|uniref:ParA family protein n=1 Tax=Borreliella afzelii TaxID=29518 RepID=UPI00359C87D7
MDKKPNILTMGNLKGGVGKSTLTILFAYLLKDLGKKVLIIDMDPQNSITSYFLKYVYHVETYNTYSMLKGSVPFNKCISKVNDYIYIIPAHPVLENFNSDSIDYKEIILEFRIEQNILAHEFDYILLDTPPNRDFLIKNALNITDHIVIPVQLERWSIESFIILMDMIKNFQIIKKKIYTISIVENQFIKNRNTLKDIESLLYEEYGNYIKGKIHFSNGIKVFINELIEPSSKEGYYKEAKETLQNILYSTRY